MKNLRIKNPIVFTSLILWLGVFITVSFIETPMKFQVEGMTLPVALGLGKIMFGISTNIQMVLAVIILLSFIFKKFCKPVGLEIFTFLVIVVLLLLEKFWLLPVLDSRADLLSSGKILPPSDLHDYFIYAESIKLSCLVLLTALQFKKIKYEY